MAVSLARHAIILQSCLLAVAVAVPNPAELARQNGYDAETHTVWTDDGYLLDVFRVRAGPSSPSSPSRGPVLVMPGMACNAAIWVLLGPGRALAYLLADRGYDVWLSSYRGNMFARTHENFSDYESSFWDFSFEALGRSDAPAVMARVLQVTGRSRLAYIGHSMGGSALLVLASFHPHLLASVSSAYLLAPAAFIGRTTSVVMNTTVDVVFPLLRLGGVGPLGSGEIDMKSQMARFAFKNVCKSIGATSCNFFDGAFDENTANEGNASKSLTWSDYIPDSMSMTALEHFRQHGGLRRTFRRFDYGSLNLEKYGTAKPPLYDLSKTTCPVSIYYGQSDRIVHPEDVLDLAESLPNEARPPFRPPNDNFNHGSFFLASDAKEQIYDRLLSDMDKDANTV